MPRFLASPSRAGLWLALCVGLVCLLVKHGLEVVAEQEVYLAVSVTADRKAVAYPAFMDLQAKFHGDRVLNLTPGTTPHVARVLLPRGEFQGIYLKFDPPQGGPSQISIRGIWVRNSAGTLNREIPLDYDVRGLHGLEVRQLPDKAGVAFQVVVGQPKAALALRVPPGATFGPPHLRFLPSLTALLWALIGGGLAFLAVGASKARGYDLPADFWRLAQAHPRKGICLVGAVSALVSVLPVFTDHRGIVGPFSGDYLIYEADATFPGQGSRIMAPSPLGVDVGAVLFTGLGQMRQASQHLWQDGEILLWDRFNSGGATYIGQGMFLYFSPFGWIVLLLGGGLAAWTWAFVLAKMLFPIAMGLYLRRIGVSLQVALGAALAGGFVGSFIYRTGHFAFFVAGAFPLIMLGLDGVLEPGPRRWKRALYLVCWLLGCLACFSSGALKEGVFMMLTTNALVISLRLVRATNWRMALNYVLLALALTVTFVLITAPQWMMFLATLGHLSSIYDVGLVMQKPVGSLLSMFDEFFGRIYSEPYAQFGPGLNLLFLPGLFFAVTACALRLRLREMLIPVLGALLCLALIYSIIPGALIARLKVLANIFTFHNTFGLSALPLIIVASARGWDLWLSLDGGQKPAWFNRVAYGVFVFSVAVLAILPLGQCTKRSSPVFLFFGILLLLAIFSAPLLLNYLRRWRSHRRPVNIALLAALGLVCTVSWGRYAYHSSTAFSPWLFVLPERVSGTAESTASAWVRAKTAVEPARVVGIDQTYNTGTNTYYGLEGVGGGMPLWAPAYHYFQENLPGAEVKYFWTLSVPNANTAVIAPYLEFLNCRYLFCMPGLSIPGGPPVVHTSDLEVRQLPLAWPRAYYIDRLEILENLPELIMRLGRRTGPFCSVQSATAISHPELTDLFPKPAEAAVKARFTPARDYRLTLNTTAFTVDASGPGMLVLHEVFDPGAFRVTVNGKPAEPVLVNQMFRGLHVPAAGTYRVEYRYWPPALARGLKVAVTGLLLLVALGIGFLRAAKPPVNLTDSAPSR